MIAYDLHCGEGHTFEGWFDNQQSFEEQQEKGLLTCPICGTTEITRLLSTFGIARRREKKEPPTTNSIPIMQLAKYVRDNFENVGADFAKEALKMHFGVVESRNIRGVSSAQEEETLKEQGIDFIKLPLPTAIDDD